MNISFNIGDRNFSISPYETKIEKDILILSGFNVLNLDNYLEMLGFETEYELTENEKKVILYKYREISLGDEVDVKFTCMHCQMLNETVLSLTDFIIDGSRNDPDIKKLFIPVNDETLQEFINNTIIVDELDIEEFEVLKKRVKENQITLNFIKSVPCIRCKKLKFFDVSEPKYIIESMSDETLMTMYKVYNTLVFFGKYTKLDIDSMYPFERTIFLGLLNKIKEELT